MLSRILNPSAFLCTLLTFQLSSFAQTPTNESVADLKAASSEVKSPFTFSYFMLSSLPKTQLEKEGSPSFSAYNHLSINYKLTKKTRIAFRPVFYWNTAGVNKYGDKVDSDVSLGDAHFVYSDYEMYESEDESVGLSGSIKVYLPTSDFAKKAKSISQIRGEFYLSNRLTANDTLTYVSKPEVHFQSQTAFFDDSNPAFAKVKTTKAGALDHYIEYEHNFSSLFSGVQSMGFKEEWFYASKENNLDSSHRTQFKFSVGGKIYPARGTFAILSLENTTNLERPRDGGKISFFHPDNNSLVLLLNSSI